ncbi:hypothetical protein FXO37_19045 [Capsicum annuum]|nr:hypothetical protein FXO37_19045 [Capsicum annuum]
MGSSGKLSVWESFHHSTSATSVIGKITREVASGVLRKHQKRWHGNRYIQVQQLLPRKSLSCKLVGKRPGLLLEAFPKDHYLSGSPMVIRDSMDQWPAKNKWNDMNYLRKVAGFRTVPIEPSRVGLNLCQDGAGCRESVLRCYRREVYSMSMERELPVTLGSSLEFTDMQIQFQENRMIDEDVTFRLARRLLPFAPAMKEKNGRNTLFSSTALCLLLAFPNSYTGGVRSWRVDVEGPCVASDLEKRKATVMKECIQNELPRTVRMYYRLAPGPASYLFRHSVTSLDSSLLLLICFRKDGTSFWLHISPVRNASGKVGLVSNYDLLALDSESGLHFEYSYLSSVAAPHYKED